jgi:DNA-binding Xre family transcriptional regulator
MLSLNLIPIFKARAIEKPYSFLVKAGLSPHSATNILNNKTHVFRLDHIELLCRVLVCEPNDLLVWNPDKGQNIDVISKPKRRPCNNQTDTKTTRLLTTK